LGRDIVYIKEFPGRLKVRGKYFYHKGVFWLYHLIVLVLFGSVFVFKKHDERLRSDERYARRFKAPARAKKGIRQAEEFLKQKKGGQFFEAVHKTLRGYLADKFHLPAGAITPDRVRELLGDKNIEEGVLNKLINIFNACDMVRYAPLEFDQAKREEVFISLGEAIDYLEKKKV
ncbi:MAG: hypothetical protein ABH858_06825, partial [Candidatus Omnitrophota bacterium]